MTAGASHGGSGARRPRGSLGRTIAELAPIAALVGAAAVTVVVVVGPSTARLTDTPPRELPVEHVVREIVEPPDREAVVVGDDGIEAPARVPRGRPPLSEEDRRAAGDGATGKGRSSADGTGSRRGPKDDNRASNGGKDKAPKPRDDAATTTTSAPPPTTTTTAPPPSTTTTEPPPSTTTTAPSSTTTTTATGADDDGKGGSRGKRGGRRPEHDGRATAAPRSGEQRQGTIRLAGHRSSRAPRSR